MGNGVRIFMTKWRSPKNEALGVFLSGVFFDEKDALVHISKILLSKTQVDTVDFLTGNYEIKDFVETKVQ